MTFGELFSLAYILFRGSNGTQSTGGVFPVIRYNPYFYFVTFWRSAGGMRSKNDDD